MEYTSTHRISRTAAKLMAAAAFMPLVIGSASAQSSLAEKELNRRLSQVGDAETSLLAGRKAYAEGDYELAVSKYREAASLLPPGRIVGDRYDAVLAHLVDGSVELSKKYRREGRYDEARSLLNDVLAKDPGNAAARKNLEYLDDPIRVNPSNSYEHTQSVDRVRRSLYRAEGYYNLGRYDEAEEEFKEVLREDKYNVAARRGMERVHQVKTDYYRAAYDQTRAKLLMEVDQAWEIAVAPRIESNFPTGSEEPVELSGPELISKKLKSLIIPLIDFDETTTVEEAVSFLRQRTFEVDSSLDPNNRGVDFIISSGAGVELGEGSTGSIASKPVGALRLRNVPAQQVLDYICESAGLRPRVDQYAVSLLPLSGVDDETVYTRTFQVPPNFPELISGSSNSEGGGAGDPFAIGGDGGDGGAGIKSRRPIQEVLEESGVSFPGTSSARFVSSNSTLIARNTATNLDIIEQLINQTKDEAPKQIKILTKFVEIEQDNTDELGFDWALGAPGIGAGSASLVGGVLGNGFARPVAGAFGAGSGIITGGLRSGDGALDGDTIDAILGDPDGLGGDGSVAPGILGLTGLFGEDALQLIVRGLAQKTGTDVMTAPSILARSGEEATIEIIREFIYPTEYEPPELPNTVGTTGTIAGGVLGGGGSTGFPVTPATPTAFETRNTGVTLQINPTLGGDGYTIDLRFAPEIVEFEGFINYGSPIEAPSTTVGGVATSITITENRIEMPVFATRSVNTGITIFDGHTVSVGGLIREDVQSVEDKVPILGDLPLVGRLFQSKSESRIKSNLVIFVTAKIIDATGRPIRQSNDVRQRLIESEFELGSR